MCPHWTHPRHWLTWGEQAATRAHLLLLTVLLPSGWLRCCSAKDLEAAGSDLCLAAVCRPRLFLLLLLLSLHQCCWRQRLLPAHSKRCPLVCCCCCCSAARRA